MNTNAFVRLACIVTAALALTACKPAGDASTAPMAPASAASR